MNAKPTRLEFRAEGRQLYGRDPDTGIDYRIGWCGNGQYSHWVLDRSDSPGTGWYVYTFDKGELRRSIYEAEYRLIYGAEPPQQTPARTGARPR